VFHWTLRKHRSPEDHATLLAFHALRLRFTICILVYCTIARMSSFSCQCELLSRRLVLFALDARSNLYLAGTLVCVIIAWVIVHTVSGDSLCSTLETIFKSLRSWCAFLPDILAEARRIRSKMFENTNESGYVWTEPESLTKYK
jgi:O-antigen ligase